MILNESQTILLVFNHLLSNMFRLYDESQHQAFLNNSLKIIKDWYINKFEIELTN
jgi:hypothetical protein